MTSLAPMVDFHLQSFFVLLLLLILSPFSLQKFIWLSTLETPFNTSLLDIHYFRYLSICSRKKSSFLNSLNFLPLSLLAAPPFVEYPQLLQQQERPTVRTDWTMAGRKSPLLSFYKWSQQLQCHEVTYAILLRYLYLSRFTHFLENFKQETCSFGSKLCFLGINKLCTLTFPMVPGACPLHLKFESS